MWSFGCIVVELMTLDPISPGDSSIEKLLEIKKYWHSFSREN
jgi:hypothetical protein